MQRAVHGDAPVAASGDPFFAESYASYSCNHLSEILLIVILALVLFDDPSGTGASKIPGIMVKPKR